MALKRTTKALLRGFRKRRKEAKKLGLHTPARITRVARTTRHLRAEFGPKKTRQSLLVEMKRSRA